MDNFKYYVITEEDNEKPYSYFVHKIRWNVNKIIGNNKNKNGYIVQKVNVVNTTEIGGFPKEDYYEAWKITNGKIENEKSYNYDDEFRHGSVIVEEMCKNESIGKKGNIIYNCDVFWVDSSSNLYGIVDSWKNDVAYAGELKSVYVTQEKSDFGSPIFSRHFIHKIKY